MKLAHFFLPHPTTHKKAHLISIQAFIIYILIFLTLQFGLKGLAQAKPGVLGIASDVNQQEVIRLTNVEREKYGLGEVTEDPRLDAAAAAKAANMFQENYWAHYSPSGKDPWGFIHGAGYKFSYAGENLARNFDKSNEVVDAWMNSPSHRENLLNPHYQNIGIAVVSGTLNGQETTLVVQEFGRPVEAIAVAPKTPTEPQSQPIEQAQESTSGQVLPTNVDLTNLVGNKLGTSGGGGLINPFAVTKTLGLGLVSFITLLILMDYLAMKRRAVHRLTSRHLPHLSLMAVAAIALINTSSGSIL